MKKILIGLCLLPIISVAAETGDSCSSIVDNEKRLDCYDSVFKGGNNLSESGELKAEQGDTKVILRAMLIKVKMLGDIVKLRTK